MSRTQPFPVKCFMVVLAAAVALYLVLGGLLLAVNRQAREFQERIDKLDGAVHDLQLDSETMANLALLAATTGETGFATRHAAFRDRQHEALDLLRGVGSGSLRPEDLTHLEMLLNALWATEQSALTQVAWGAPAKALPLLRAAAYAADRDTLRADLARLDAAHRGLGRQHPGRAEPLHQPGHLEHCLFHAPAGRCGIHPAASRQTLHPRQHFRPDRPGRKRPHRRGPAQRHHRPGDPGRRGGAHPGHQCRRGPGNRPAAGTDPGQDTLRPLPGTRGHRTARHRPPGHGLGTIATLYRRA